jgi:hypothetical protein
MSMGRDQMSADPNKKSARTFQCRDILWDAFQQMAQELECSVDYLINESMKQYARQRYANRTGRTADGTPGSTAPAEPPPSAPRGPTTGSGAMPPPLRTAGAPLPPPPPRARGGYSNLPPPPVTGRFPPGGAPARSSAGPPPPMPASNPPSARTVPPPLPGAARAPLPPPQMGTGRFGPPTPANYAGQLSVLYAGERLPVNKDRFIIGRGKQSSDLTIKDPNVSRQHAMIEFLNGQYYMVDMGSTNGVEYNGQRIQRRPIGEGDVYRICDHEVGFTYR